MENYPGKVSAQFPDRDAAETAYTDLQSQAGLDDAQLELIAPYTPPGAADRRIQPETRQVRHSLIRWHLVLGGAGLVFGLLLAGTLINADIQLFSLSPGYTFLGLTLVMTLLGLMAGGLVSLRPDQTLLAARIKDEVKQGAWTLVAHVRDTAQKESVEALMHRRALRVQSTL